MSTTVLGVEGAPTPAGYSFEVVLGEPALPMTTPIPPVPAAPNTTIFSKPPAETRDRTPTFRFRANEAGVTFRCKLDRGPFRRCRSPFTTKPLSFGRHTIEIEALAGGLADPSPAKVRFRVVRGRGRR